jgi:DNA-binding response OmpR family regulator
MRGKILAVDDEPDQLALVELLLTEAGFDVGTAPNGVAAIEKVRQNRPDLIVLDVSMPQMNGFTFCEMMRQSAATATIPIIFLTGLRSHFDRLNGYAHGGTAYLTKPFATDELVDKVLELLHASKTGKA